MVSTVTSSTISTISTNAAGLTTAIGIISVLALIALLTTKELASAGQSGTSRLVAKYCDIGILPLTFAFAVTVVVKVIEILA
jgi:hypothetical protein